MLENEKISYQIIPVEEYSDGKKFRITIQVPMSIGWIERMKFSVVKGKEKSAFQMKHLKNENGFVYFETYVVLKNSALYYYYFSFEANRTFRYFKRINKSGDNSITHEEYWKMSVGFDVPEWAKGQIMYHIFVDRYRRGSREMLPIISNRKIHKCWNERPVIGPDEDGNWNVDFYGGDLLGIKETLNYIKSLGVSIIYLSPIVRSQSNHRYDTADYETVDPYAGSNEALKALCDAAHAKGMHVILDAVFNHTGNDSKYFNQYGTYPNLGAYQSENSPYSSFYRKYWDRGEMKFAYWWGMTNLPECDGNSPEWKEYILGKDGIIDKWFSLGIDGLRLDVADELTDEFIEGIRNAVKRNKPDGFILGEVWKNPMRMNRGYIESGRGMDTVMNYLFIDSLIRYFKYSDCDKLKYTIEEIFSEYPEETIFSLMNFTSTHDISRAIEIFGSNEFQMYGEWAWNLQNENLDWVKSHKLTPEQYKYGREVLEAYVFTLMFFPGNVSIFYGDEVGMQGIGNLANRTPYTWQNRDKKLLRFFKKMGKMRKKEAFLKTAELKVISIDEQKIIFERFSEHEKALVIVSRTHNSLNCSIPYEYQNAKCSYHLKKVCFEKSLSEKEYLGQNKESMQLENVISIQLEPYGAVALKVKE